MLAAFGTTEALRARVAAQCQRRGDTLGWYVPDQAKLQTGGQLGMITLAAGYSVLDMIGLDLYYGFVPAVVGGTDVHTVALRVDARAPGLCLRRDLSWRYLTAGMGALMTFGDGFFLSQPDRYPPDYYYETALRGFLTLGTALQLRHPDTSAIAATSAFIEVTVLDIYALAWFKNPGTVSFWDIWSTSLGLRFGF